MFQVRAGRFSLRRRSRTSVANVVAAPGHGPDVSRRHHRHRHLLRRRIPQALLDENVRTAQRDETGVLKYVRD